jgi:aromatic-L-amino-acid decarboxylase
MSLAFEPADLLNAIERAAHIVADFYENLEERSVTPPVQREALRRALHGTLGDTGVGLEQALDEVERIIIPGAMGTPHPGYLGLVNSSPLPGGIVADLLVSALNNNGGAYGQSPSMTTAEEEVVRAFRVVLGLDDSFSGMLLPGGTLATLQALQLARDHHFPAWRQGGASTLDGPPRVYTSDAAHFSVARAAHTLGVGAEHVIEVPTLGRGRMDTRALDDVIERDSREGMRPFSVVATIGTTGTGAIDDIDAIVNSCRRRGLWLHVDACYGGAAVFLDELRPRFASLRFADSVCVDPHKWFFVPITAGLVLTRHPQADLVSYDVDASYIPGDGTVDAFRRGLPTSRRSSGLAVWLAVRAHGWSAVRAAVHRNVELSRLMESRLADAGFRVLPDGELSIVCARWEPAGCRPDEIDALQDRIAEQVRASGVAWFATVRHEELVWLRLNMVNIHTRERHVRAIVDRMIVAAREVERAAACGSSELPAGRPDQP